ncbi:hypothetical protein BDR26DRAFT_866934 [Obelidium mucronatum]|nr:hypothetical protein BDR26DRAFT_866934 [Obelidium mucronatum]
MADTVMTLAPAADQHQVLLQKPLLSSIHPSQLRQMKIPPLDPRPSASGSSLSTSMKKFTCPELDCNKSFFRRHHLVSHLVSHTEGKPYSCQIEGCEATFRRCQDMRRHMRKVDHSAFLGSKSESCQQQQQTHGRGSLRRRTSAAARAAAHAVNTAAAEDSGDDDDNFTELSPTDLDGRV